MSAPDAIRTTSLSAGFSLILPGTWESVPLEDPERMRRAVSRLVKTRVPRDDRLARMRREIRDELLANTSEAARAGADLYALCMEIMPGIPFPASLLGVDTTWPPGTDLASDPDARLRATVPDGVIVESAPVPTVRTGGLSVRRLTETAYPSLDLQYRCAAPGGGLVILTISLPTCPAEDPVTELFDAIVSSIRWAPVDARP